jgi:hypothetical protein
VLCCFYTCHLSDGLDGRERSTPQSVERTKPATTECRGLAVDIDEDADLGSWFCQFLLRLVPVQLRRSFLAASLFPKQIRSFRNLLVQQSACVKLFIALVVFRYNC